MACPAQTVQIAQLHELDGQMMGSEGWQEAVDLRSEGLLIGSPMVMQPVVT